ncbi:hypothetical protein [Humisphaera borealis]|uniref:Uncharacterized protein n=1 Tax=Humisphaera borealis TaxID=2807512 RepID=A0A7M2WV70_9BACT|nr:hypothetical protein [Humisphaera borealis]QOV88731.1 hypothetical protein IPV69_21250 [Humisphaera borealis]
MRFVLVTAVALAAGSFVGCKEEPKVSPTTAATNQPSMADKLKDDAAKAAEKAKEGAAALGDKAKEGAEKVKEGTEKALDKTKEGAEKVGGDIKDAVKGTTEGTADKGLMAKVQEEATKYYDQAMEAIKKKDFSAADSAVANLDKIKGQLSPEWQSKVDTLKATLEQAKKAGAIKIPGVTE